MQLFSEGIRVQPARAAKKPRAAEQLPPDQRALDKGFVNSLQGLLDDGAFSKAAKHLLSKGLHDGADPEVRRILESLHPKAAPPGSLEGGQPFEWGDDEEVCASAPKPCGRRSCNSH